MGVRIPPPLPELGVPGKRNTVAGGRAMASAEVNEVKMATDAVKVKTSESQGSAIAGVAYGVGEKVSGSLAEVKEFLDDSRVALKEVRGTKGEQRVSHPQGT